MIKTFNLVTAFLVIGIAVLFALTPQAYAGHCGDDSIHFTDGNCYPQVTSLTVEALTSNQNQSVSSILEGGTQSLSVRIVTLPSSSLFPVDQTVTLSVASPPTRPLSATDPYVSYTPIMDVQKSYGGLRFGFINFRLSLALTDDEFNHADFPLVITATASPSGATGSATITLRDNDISISSSVPTVSVGTGQTTNYTVQLGEQPPADTTVSVVSQTTANATVSPATLTFTPTDWNMPQTVTVSGVLVGTANIRHTAPDNSGFSYIANDVGVTVTIPNVLAFATGASISDQIYTQGTAISELTLPAVETAGNGATTYTLTPAIAGLSLHPTTHMLTGTPTTVSAATQYTYTATDEGGDTDTLTFSITVEAEEDTAPSFGGASVPDQTYTINMPIMPLELPSATGGNGVITYSITPPVGLEFDPLTRILSGTPTALLNNQLFSYSVFDSDDNSAGSDADRIFIGFTVLTDQANIVPAFADALTIPRQVYIQNSPITPLELPEVATVGDGTTTYSLLTGTRVPITDLSIHIPGLEIDVATRTISGTPTDASAVEFFYWVAADSDAITGDTDEASIIFRIEVRADTTPTFSSLISIPNRVYTLDTAINALTLPAVETAGNGATTYTLTPAIAGLSLHPTTHILTGTPTTPSAATQYTYTATDEDGDTDTLTFSITVVENTLSYDFTQNGSVTQSDGLVFYLLASGVSVAATSIVVEREGNSPIRTAPSAALEALKADIDNNDDRYDFTQNGSVTQSDGLVFYLLASGVSVAATSIVVEREGNSPIRTAPSIALEALKAAIEN